MEFGCPIYPKSDTSEEGYHGLNNMASEAHFNVDTVEKFPLAISQSLYFIIIQHAALMPLALNLPYLLP